MTLSDTWDLPSPDPLGVHISKRTVRVPVHVGPTGTVEVGRPRDMYGFALIAYAQLVIDNCVRPAVADAVI